MFNQSTLKYHAMEHINGLQILITIRIKKKEDECNDEHILKFKPLALTLRQEFER